MNNKKTFRPYIFLLFIGILCSLATVGIYLKYIQEKSIEHIVQQTKIPHNIIKNEINNYKDKKLRMMKMLSEHSHMHNFLHNSIAKDQIENLFYSIVKSDRDYMQLRFIDTKGFEKIRIDQDRQGNIKIIEGDFLQDKSNRAYVKDFMKLEKGVEGYSTFDLNIENGKIEIPFNPTLRVGYKVFLDDELKGIIVMNIYMEEWVNNIFNVNSFKITVIDKNNYYKTHYNKELSWSEYRQVPIKASSIPNWQTLKNDHYILSVDTVARGLNLFNEVVLITYKMPRNMRSVLIENISSLLFTMFISFLFIFVPISLIIYQYIKIIKNAEIYQRSIFDNMFDAMVIIDQKAKVLEVNKQAVTLFGYKTEEIIGQNVNTIIPQPHHSKHDEYVKNYNKKGRTIVGNNRELEALCKDGKTVPIALAVTKMNINNTNLFIGVARDLREIRKLEAENKKQDNMLQHQAKLASMGEMIGAIAHQWRQPLNELGIRIQNIKYAYMNNEINEEYIKEFIDKNKKTISFMSDTIDDFRDFFRIDKEKSEFDVVESIDAVINMQSAQLKDHNIEINFSRIENFTYNGFRSEFQQVILNLINNAKDALIENNISEPKIQIIVQNKKVIIKDNAGGIPNDVIERIFEPYFTTKEQGKGTGMGLYMTKMIIVDNMGANISVKNDTNGAAFTIFLEDEKVH